MKKGWILKEEKNQKGEMRDEMGQGNTYKKDFFFNEGREKKRK